MGISQATFFNWKKKYGGLGLTELRKLKQLEEENNQLERVENNSVNKVWSMDFVQDALFDKSKFRILSIVDNFSKKCHSLAVRQSMKGADVVWPT